MFFRAVLNNKNRSWKICTVFLALITFVCSAPTAQAKDNPRYASIVMDADTGLILYQRNADKKLHPASLTKVMTLLMVFDALEQGKITLNDRVTISKRAASMVPSKLGLAPGSTIKVKDAIGALVTKSANDIAVALAEHVGSTESNFARLMTVKARSLGMSGTVFTNASGLHNKSQITTARDMAKLAQIVINDYPEYYRYFSMKNFTYQGKSYHNHNRLMDSYKGMDGMKTGYTVPSGFNLVSSAVRNNRRLIGVVMGGRSAQTRNAHMAALLDSGFGRLNEIRVASAKVPLPPRKPGILLALNSLNNTSPSSGEIIGQGDYDPTATARAQQSSKREVSPALAASAANSMWAIQIGAFTSRAATDQALSKALRKLPQQYTQASPLIAPLKTDAGWLFRGRLTGLTEAQAVSACRHLRECLPVAPQTN